MSMGLRAVKGDRQQAPLPVPMLYYHKTLLSFKLHSNGWEIWVSLSATAAIVTAQPTCLKACEGLINRIGQPTSQMTERFGLSKALPAPIAGQSG